MAQIELIDEYINKSDVLISRGEATEEVKNLVNEIYAIYAKQMSVLNNSLKCKFSRIGTYIDDLRILQSALKKYKCDLIQQQSDKEREFACSRVGDTIFKVENINNNNNDSSANATSTAESSSTVDIKITFKKMLDDIKHLDNEILSEEEKEELEDMLSAVQTAQDIQDEPKMIKKIGNVLKYIGDKSVEVGIAALPYLGQISQLIGNR